MDDTNSKEFSNLMSSYEDEFNQFILEIAKDLEGLPQWLNTDEIIRDAIQFEIIDDSASNSIILKKKV